MGCSNFSRLVFNVNSCFVLNDYIPRFSLFKIRLISKPALNRLDVNYYVPR